MTFKATISNTIWDLKYRYKNAGKNIDTDIETTWQRLAKACAKAEKPAERAHWQAKFLNILRDFRYLPGGRILAGAGTAHRVTLFNCFVMNIEEDSLKGIFKALSEGALTLQQGGGVGYDFSVLRPAGMLAKKTGLSAAGPVAFMRIWDTTCSILLSTGARRGAMMGVLRCDHPDIETFIEAKKNPQMLRHFNVSVMVSDAFMQAVKNNEEWALVFPTDDPSEKGVVHRVWGQALKPVPCRIYRYVSARKLWEKIIHSAYDYAEPGVLFGDTINRFNNLWYRERINATNPCGEIPLPAYGACNLGAINLTQFVREAFTDKANINWQSLEEVVQAATRFQDNVIDISLYPLKAQAKEAQGTRRIGLGVSGLADALVMLGLLYGSNESIDCARTIMQKIAEITWLTSIELAQEKGVFPYFEPDYLHGKFVDTLPSHVKKRLASVGVRNSHHNTIAPTGTTSLLANNISNGIEPIFKAEYHRHIRTETDEILTVTLQDYALMLWREKHSGLPPAWVDTDALEPLAHLHIQAAMQPYIDNAISKTINLPAAFPLEKLQTVYSEAYQLGLKGCTVFRPNAVTGSVLQGIKEEESTAHCCPHD